MITKLRRAIFTYIDVHSVEGCYRYYYLFGFEMLRFRAGCLHDIFDSLDGYDYIRLP
jgi:hypothetical protein